MCITTITATAGGIAVSEGVTLTVTHAHAAQVTLGTMLLTQLMV